MKTYDEIMAMRPKSKRLSAELPPFTKADFDEMRSASIIDILEAGAGEEDRLALALNLKRLLDAYEAAINA